MERIAFFGGLPVRGIWTSLGLSRWQFFLLLALSVGAFVFIDGPVWQHPSYGHFRRITLSYVLIMPTAALALWHNRALSWSNWLTASAVIAFIKFIATALLLMAIGLAR